MAKTDEEKLADIKLQALDYIYDSIFRDFIYKNRADMNPFYEQIHEMAGDSGDFFVSWSKGFVALADFDFDEAEKHYENAFENIENAGDYLVHFLQQSFALFMYDEKTDSALKFWNYGVSKGLFAKPTEKFFDSFNAKEQFWVQFSPKMFKNQKKAEEKVISDYQKKSDDKILLAIDSCDFEKFDEVSESEKIDFDSYKVAGVSVLYYAVQKKGILKSGPEKFSEELVQARSLQLYRNLDLSSIPEKFRSQQYLNILHEMRATYEKSGLARLIFIAENGSEEKSAQKIDGIKKIIEKCVEKTTDVDAFSLRLSGKMGTNALFLAAELDDEETLELLVQKGSDVDKKLGFAEFGMSYKDGSSVKTQIPNSLIYRLINFKSWKSLELYLTKFKEKAAKSMKEKSQKCDITPLVYFILNTVYGSSSESEFKANKLLADKFIPLFTAAGASLEEKTAFGSAKKLLGI